MRMSTKHTPTHAENIITNNKTLAETKTLKTICNNLERELKWNTSRNSNCFEYCTSLRKIAVFSQQRRRATGSPSAGETRTEDCFHEGRGHWGENRVKRGRTADPTWMDAPATQRMTVFHPTITETFPRRFAMNVSLIITGWYFECFLLGQQRECRR